MGIPLALARDYFFLIKMQTRQTGGATFALKACWACSSIV